MKAALKSYRASLRQLGGQLAFVTRYVRRYRLLLALFPFLIAVDVLFDIGIAKMQGLFIDTAHEGNASGLRSAIWWTALALTAAIALLVVHRFFIRLLRGLLDRDLSADLFRTVGELPYEEIQGEASGDLITRIREDTRSGAELAEAAIEFVTVVVIIAASFGYLLFIDAALAFFALVGAPLLLMIGRVFDRPIQRQSAAIQALEGGIRGMTVELLQGMNVVRIYGLRDELLPGIAAAREQLNRNRRKLDMTRSLSASLTESVFYLLHIGALLLISLAAARGSLTPGTIVTFSLLFELVIWPVIGLSEQWNRLFAGGGAFERIHELMARRKQPVRTVDGTVEEGMMLTMRQAIYRPTANTSPILDNVDFSLRQGEIVAVVGASGSGKSTFAALCAGLLQPTGGTVMSRRSLSDTDRADTMFVTQQPFLFAGSIRDNIRLGANGTCEAEVAAAARAACIDADIERLEHGYEAATGERGDGLSGGQKQRIHLARMYACNPDFIIMDEPTSALDAATEHRVIREMHGWLNGRTALIVTHRLELARLLAQRIIVMEQGRIVDEGTHESLLKQSGRYRRMYNLSHIEAMNFGRL